MPQETITIELPRDEAEAILEQLTTAAWRFHARPMEIWDAADRGVAKVKEALGVDPKPGAFHAGGGT